MGYHRLRTGAVSADQLTAAMPLPPSAGDLDQLWDFVNVSIGDRPVLLAVLIAALVQCDVPHPVLALFAEQGSAKSTTTRMLVDLIDPSPVPLRQAPRDADSWVTAASGSWVVALDNLSAIPPWLSDSLCRAATGDGNVKRALYTDADLAVVKFRRCVIVNGIDVGAVRPDLAERMAIVDLRRIERQMRQPEATMRQQWRLALPGIFESAPRPGRGLHHRLDTIVVDDAPRMADFGRVLAAVDEVLSTNGLPRYMSRADQLSEDSLSADPFIEQLRQHTREPLVGKSGGMLTWPPPAEITGGVPRNGPRTAATSPRFCGDTRRRCGTWDGSSRTTAPETTGTFCCGPSIRRTKMWWHNGPRDPRVPRCYGQALPQWLIRDPSGFPRR